MIIVLVPGFMLDNDLWRDVEPGLAEIGSIQHADLGLDDTLTGMAERALRDAPPSFVLVGFSMGGYVARKIVRIAPERVSALVLVATSARGDTAVQARRKAALALRASDELFGGLSRSAILPSLHPDRRGSETLVARMQAMSRRLGGAVFRRQSMLERRDERALLADIRCPTLVIAGERDGLRTLAEAEELRDGIPGATLEVVEGTGHMIPLEAPERLAEIMAGFLSRTLGPLQDEAGRAPVIRATIAVLSPGSMPRPRC